MTGASLRNTLALVGSSLSAWAVLGFVSRSWWSAICPGGCHFDGFAAAWMFDALPMLVVYALAAVLLRAYLRSTRTVAWVLALGAIGVVLYFARSQWIGGIDTVEAAIEFVLWQVPPLLGALLGWAVWRVVSWRRIAQPLVGAR